MPRCVTGRSTLCSPDLTKSDRETLDGGRRCKWTIWRGCRRPISLFIPASDQGTVVKVRQTFTTHLPRHEIALKTRLRRASMTIAAGAENRPPRARVNFPSSAAADRGVADVTGSRSLRQHPPDLRYPVAHLRRLVRRGGAQVPSRRAPHRGPLPGRPRRLRRQHCHAPPGRLRHIESP